MPYLPRSITDGAIFLYGSLEEAKSRVHWGGSGFLVGVPSQGTPESVHLYAVSNQHVTIRCPAIRLTKANGDVQIIPAEPLDWVGHPAGDDVAVCALGPVPALEEKFREMRIPMDAHLYFDAERLVKVEDFNWGVGPSIGDECLMVGRYVNLAGEQFDRAAVRFGNLSMFPEEVRQIERAFDQESFLVDMRSTGGFSGSVVVLYFTQPGTLSMFSSGGPQMPWRTLLSKYWILGVDWGHLPVDQRIWENGQSTRIKADSSMAAVIPAWKVTELLNDAPQVVTARIEAEAALLRTDERTELTPSEHSSETPRHGELWARTVTVPRVGDIG